MPKVSFVMATRNRGDLIGQTIESIINQTEKDWELIIVDDHSDSGDKTAKVVKSFNDGRIKYYELSDENGMNTPAARNFGNIMATADIIAVIDSDDICYPDRLKRTLKAFKTGADVVYGEIDLWDNETGEIKKIEGEWQSRDHEPDAHKKINYIPHSTVAYKRELALLLPYNSFFRRAQDWDLLLRMTKYGAKFKFISGGLVKYRVHSGRISVAKDLKFDYVELLRNNYKFPIINEADQK